ncbi:MAG: DUF4397 domain-containing protein [Acidimicrobiales bacterium]
MRLRNRFGTVAVAVAMLGAGVVASGIPAQAAVAKAEVTVVHGIPNTPVDVYANGKILLNDFVFGKVAGPVALTPGKYTLAIRPHGAAASTTPILSKTISVVGGENASVVANLTATGSPTLSVFANPTTAVAMGDSRIIVRHLAEAPGVDIYAGTTKVATDLTNPHQVTLVIPAANAVPISVDVTGTTTTVIGPANFNFPVGTTTIIYAIGSATASPSTLTVAVQTYK